MLLHIIFILQLCLLTSLLFIEDTVSMNFNIGMGDTFNKSIIRHSVRSLQHPMLNSESNEHRLLNHSKLVYSNSNNMHSESSQHMLYEDSLVPNMKLNVYKNRVERYVIVQF